MQNARALLGLTNPQPSKETKAVANACEEAGVAVDMVKLAPAIAPGEASAGAAVSNAALVLLERNEAAVRGGHGAEKVLALMGELHRSLASAGAATAGGPTAPDNSHKLAA